MELFKQSPTPKDRAADVLKVGRHWVPVYLARNARARHYILRIRDDGSVRVTIPRWGTLKEGRAFAREKMEWIEKQLDAAHRRPMHKATWQHDYPIHYRGHLTPIRVESFEANHRIHIEDQSFTCKSLPNDLRRLIETFLRNIATLELTQRTIQLAQDHDLVVRRVTIRDQKTRWGSCSSRGNISLNWRLIQTPDWVRDYIIVHELMHLHHMNHSKRYWARVANAYPRYKEAEAWLRKNTSLLRG